MILQPTSNEAENSWKHWNDISSSSSFSLSDVTSQKVKCSEAVKPESIIRLSRSHVFISIRNGEGVLVCRMYVPSVWASLVGSPNMVQSSSHLAWRPDITKSHLHQKFDYIPSPMYRTSAKMWKLKSESQGLAQKWPFFGIWPQAKFKNSKVGLSWPNLKF